MSDSSGRTPLVLLSGVDRTAVARAAMVVLHDVPGTVVVHHDVGGIDRGVVVRTVRASGPDGVTSSSTALEPAHGCVNCTLRLDLLPLLTELAVQDGVDRVVLQLDPTLEPEHLCWAVGHVLLEDTPRARGTGQAETASAYVEVEAVVVTVDAATWLADATGDEALAERGLAATPDDERTVAQVAVGQLAVADVVLLHGHPDDGWSAARLRAVLDRLVHGSVRTRLDRWKPVEVLAAIGPDARRGRPATAHDPLLPGQPPLGEDAGVALARFGARRPFHPARLHEALDVLLDGVVCSRGRLWLAARHDAVLWMESAGGGLRIGDAGPWLATYGDDDALWADVDDQRRVSAALRWDPVHGDRDNEVVVLTHRQSPAAVIAALDAALLTDDELAAGPAAWAALPDPFGAWHQDPCEAGTPADDGSTHATTGEERT